MTTSSSTAQVLTMQQDIKENIERHGRQGHEQICNSSSDGKVVWTVVDKVVDDDFETIRKFEDKKFEDQNYSPMIDPDILKSLNFSESFWYLWPTEIDDDVII